MNVVTDKAAAMKLYKSNFYTSYDRRNKKPGQRYHFNYISVTGGRSGNSEGDDGYFLEEELDPVLCVTWDSTWYTEGDERAKDADFFVIFKVPGGLAVATYECGGYSTMTFEPTQVTDYMPNGTMEAVGLFCLEDSNRRHLEAAMAEMVLR